VKAGHLIAITDVH